MSSKRDVLYSMGLYGLTVIFTIILCFSTQYYVSGVNIPNYTIIQHIMFSNRKDFFNSILYSAPYMCNAISVNQWIIILIPMLSAIPFLMQFADEFCGFYRLKLIRMSYNAYWNKVFLKNGICGASAVTIGYIFFSIVIFAVFPHIDEYDNEEIFLLNSPLNKAFQTQSEFIYWLNQAINIFAFVFLISQVCLILYLIFLNRYKAIGLPIIIFYLLDQISNSLFMANDMNGKYYIIGPNNILFYTEFSFESCGLNYWWYFIFIIIITSYIYILGKKIYRKRILN